MTFLEGLELSEPELASDCSEIAGYYQKKLWHQFTCKIESCMASPSWNNKGDLPHRFYLAVLNDVGYKLNLLKLAHFAVHASKSCPTTTLSVEFLASTISRIQDMKQGRSALEPILFLQMHIAQFKLETAEGGGGGAEQQQERVTEAKVIVEKGKEDLDKLSDVDPSVSAAVYYVKGLYHRTVKEYAEYFRSTLMYLSFVSSDTLPEDFKRSMAVDVSLSALLGEHIYTFGQLLQHPIVLALDETPNQWIHEMLQVFNNGDLHRYDELCQKYGAQLNAQPALVQHERRLREKITLMALVEMISSLPAESRCLSLVEVGARTKLGADGVEMLLMKALSLHLIEGSIDQVAGTVQIAWVQSRILTKPQMLALKDRLDAWIGKVGTAAATLEQESVGVVEASLA